MEGPAFRWGCQNLIPVSGRLLCGPVDVSGMRFSRVGEISWEALREMLMVWIRDVVVEMQRKGCV